GINAGRRIGHRDYLDAGDGDGPIGADEVHVVRSERGGVDRRAEANVEFVRWTADRVRIDQLDDARAADEVARGRSVVEPNGKLAAAIRGGHQHVETA